jgi:hypothetical protein
MTEVPPGFECDAPAEGYYSQAEQFWTIRPRSEHRYDSKRGRLCIGGPGVDGIEFGLLQGRRGVFAYYPISGEYVLKSATVADLIAGWLSGAVNV